MTPLPIEDPAAPSAQEDYTEQELASIDEWISKTCVDVPPDEGEVESEEEVEEDDDEASRGQDDYGPGRGQDGEDQQEEFNDDERVPNTGAPDEDDDEVPPSEPDDHGPTYAVFTEPDNMWDNGETITYAFLGPSPLSGTPNQRKKVTKVLTGTRSTWKDFANIKFKLLPSENAADAIVRVQFIQAMASWAHIGKRNKDVDSDKPTMNLGWIADDDNLTDVDRGVILHEFGHVLGLLHEHQSPAIGGLITMKPLAVKQAFKKLGWTEKQVDEQMLKQYEQSELTNYSEFDCKSIMMYFMPKVMNNENIDIPPNDALSKFDKAFVAVHYPYFGPRPPRDANARIENALRVLGIAPDPDEEDHAYGSGLLPVGHEPETTDFTEEENAKAAQERAKKLENKEKIMKLYRMGDWMGIRNEVKEIYKSVREERMQAVRLRFQALAKPTGK